MLSTTKNTLLNKVLRLEIDFIEYMDNTYYDNQTAEQSIAHKIIADNLTSIKKQLKKL